jgi:hypothetical protein
MHHKKLNRVSVALSASGWAKWTSLQLPLIAIDRNYRGGHSHNAASIPAIREAANHQCVKDETIAVQVGQLAQQGVHIPQQILAFCPIPTACIEYRGR